MFTQSERHGVERDNYILMEHEEAHGSGPQPSGLADCTERGCCLSSCVLVLAGGATYWPGNIGLHRPTSEDFSSLSYLAIKERLKRGIDSIRSYLGEMEVSERLYEAMMAVPSDELLLISEDKAVALMTGRPIKPDGHRIVFAPSIYEWSKPRCQSSRHLERDRCMSHEIKLESIRLSKALFHPGDKQTEGLFNPWR